MEFGGLLKFLELLQSTEAAGHVTERDVGRKRLRVECIFRFFSGVRSGLIFPGFDLRAILRRKNLGTLQIFFGVNVLEFFLLRFFAGAFLLGCIGNVLRVTFRREK
jgi:hypothetical protein